MANDKPDSFQCGPFVRVSNPDAGVFAEKLNKLREAVDQCRIQPGVGYTLTRSSGGTSLTIKTGSGSTAAEDLYPFKIKVRKKDTKYQFFVTLGFVGDNSIIASNIEKWVDFTPPATIYLEAKIADLKVTALEFKAQQYLYILEPVTIFETQIASRIAIGVYYNPLGNENYTLIQQVKTNLALKLVCSDGYPVLLMTQVLLVDQGVPS
jgi:hypothetical protein